jgi:hypothetical protein
LGPQSLATPPNNRFWGTKDSQSYFIAEKLFGRNTQENIMTTPQAILFGAMLAWTPSVIVLALLLRDIPELEDKEELSHHGPG